MVNATRDIRGKWFGLVLNMNVTRPLCYYDTICICNDIRCTNMLWFDDYFNDPFG